MNEVAVKNINGLKIFSITSKIPRVFSFQILMVVQIKMLPVYMYRVPIGFSKFVLLFPLLIYSSTVIVQINMKNLT